MKILIIDDDADVLRMMTRVLTHRGHEVMTCRGPFGASVKALRGSPELILLDLHMPALDGIALSGVLEQIPLSPRPPIVLWSSSDDDTLRETAELIGLPTLSKNRHIGEILDELERIHARPSAPAFH